MKQEKITFCPDGGEAVEFYVVEQTRISGVNYILVTEEPEGDSDALILKDISKDEDEDSIYTIVSDDTELDAVAGIFADLLEDVEFISEE